MLSLHQAKGFQLSEGYSMKPVEIADNIEKFLSGYGQNEGLKPTGRDASFDYCFNYFQSFRETNNIKKLISPGVIQISCLQLGFYLASWGMYRGKSPLLQRSVKYLEPLIEYLVLAPKELWGIDANCYTPANIQLLIECRKDIERALACRITDTLATKIMLGVFGNVPAFDTSFMRGFGVSAFGKSALLKIGTYYKANQAEIDGCQIPTFDFLTGKHTSRFYTRAKLIDMLFFIEGL